MIDVWESILNYLGKAHPFHPIGRARQRFGLHKYHTAVRPVEDRDRAVIGEELSNKLADAVVYAEALGYPGLADDIMALALRVDREPVRPFRPRPSVEEQRALASRTTSVTPDRVAGPRSK
jgi:hypothetical protein